MTDSSGIDRRDGPEEDLRRWERRLRFWRRSVIIDGLCPILGAGLTTFLVLIESSSIPAYVAAMGLISAPGADRLISLLSGGRG